MKFTTTLLGLGLSLASIAVAAPTGGWPGWHKPDPSNSTLFGPIKVAPEFVRPVVVDRPDTDLPQPVHFAGEKMPYQVISVTRINKRGHVEDYDMTEEEELEREMCNVCKYSPPPPFFVGVHR